MASESSILLLINLALGESSYGSYSDWGAVTDFNLGALEATVGEVTSKTLTSSNVTLSDAEERSLLIKLSGTLSANVEVRTNDRKGFWFVSNATTGDFTVTFKPTSGTGIVVPQGGTAILACDGTNTLRIGSTGANGAGVKIKHATKAAGSYTAAVSDDGALHEVTATATISLKPAALLGDQWSLLVKANGAVATIDPDGAELINGASTLAIASGTSALVVCTGTAFRAVIIGEVGATSPAFLTSFSVSGSATGTMGTLTSTAASSTTSGPTLSFDRTNATSANHRGGKLDFRYQDASGNALESFAALESVVFTATAGAEFGGLIVSTKQGGASADRWAFGLGFFGAGAVSGDMGANTINAVGYYINGNAIQATQADMETGTSTTLLVSPGRQHSHPGHPKFWAWVTQSGATPSLTTSYNVTSITDTGLGQLTVTIGTDFSSADWCCVALVASTSDAGVTGQSTKAAGSVLIYAFGGTADPGSGGNPGWNVMGLGDQA